jgi:hypothetical protein
MIKDEIMINPLEKQAIEIIVKRLYPEELPFKPLIIELSRKNPLKAMYILTLLTKENIALDCSLLIYYELEKMDYPGAKISAIKMYKYLSPIFIGLKEAKNIVVNSINSRKATLQYIE